MKTLILISIFTIFSLVTSDEINSLFAKEYFQDKNIKQAVVFACWSYYRILNFVRHMMDSDIKVSYNDILENHNMKSTLKVDYYKLGIFLDLDCPGDIFSQFASILPFNESYFWLAITKSDQIPMEILRDLPLTVATELTIALRKNNSYLLYDVYNHSFRHGGKINVTYMGFWNQSSGLKIFLNQYKYKRRADFQGLTLNFSVAYARPPEPDLETYMTTAINPHRDSLSRFHYALVQQLKDMYNFSIHMTKAKTWGYIVNGTFNGILGDMIAGIVDVSAAPFLYSLERIGVCEWTVQTYFARPVIMFRHPKKNEVHNVFLKPLAKQVWWAIAIFGIVVWSLLLLIIKMEINIKDESEISSLYSNPYSESAIIMMAAFSQQGSYDVPRFCSGRIFCLSLFFWGLLIYQFYSASIVGSLLAESPRFINTVHDLLRTGMEVGIEDVGYNHNFLRTPPDDRCRALKKRVQENTKKGKSSFFNATEGIRKMKNGGFAFLVDVATAYRIIEESFTDTEICDLTEIQAYDPSDLGLVTSKHSPFKKMIIYGLRQTITSGITKRHRTIWHHRRPHCPPGHSSLPVPVHFQEFSPAIFLLLAGLSFAMITLLTEKFFQRTFPHRFENPDEFEQEKENSSLEY